MVAFCVTCGRESNIQGLGLHRYRVSISNSYEKLTRKEGTFKAKLFVQGHNNARLLHPSFTLVLV